MAQDPSSKLALPAAIALLRDQVPWQRVRHQAANALLFADADGTPCVLSFWPSCRWLGERRRRS